MKNEIRTEDRLFWKIFHNKFKKMKNFDNFFDHKNWKLEFKSVRSCQEVQFLIFETAIYLLHKYHL
jgi:hypothetical protein